MDTNLANIPLLEELDTEKNDFPFGVFRKELQEVMLEFHKVQNLNVDYMGATMLFAFSLAIGNHYKIQIKKKWVESCVVWIALVGKAGINKSAPLSIFLEPFRELDKQYYKDYKEDLDRFNEQMNSKRRGKSNKKGMDSTEFEEIVEENLKSPCRKQFLISDFTPEALSVAHEDNPNGIGIYSDELLTWINNFNRYTKSGEEQFYLSVWSCREININRRNSQHIYISDPFINVIGTIQPEKLADTFGKGRDKSGFTHRILFAYPDSILREDLSDFDVQDIFFHTYGNLIKGILNRRTSDSLLYGEEPRILKLDKDAYEAFRVWRGKNNNRINQSEDDSLNGIYSKIEIYLLRIALIFQVVDDELNKEESRYISSKSVSAAIELITYFERKAVKVNKMISKYNDPLSNYSLDKRTIYMALPPEFTTSKGIEVSQQLNMPRRTFFDFLSDDNLFEKTKHGNYCKKV